jgi:hypothetical protein
MQQEVPGGYVKVNLQQQRTARNAAQGRAAGQSPAAKLAMSKINLQQHTAHESTAQHTAHST